MADSFYTGMRDTVAGPLIEKYGIPLTLIRTTPGAYNAATGTRAAATTVNHSCYALIDNYTAGYIEKGLVKIGDLKLLVSAKGLTVTPQSGDMFTGIDGGTYYIPVVGEGSHKPVEALSPGDVPVMFTVQVRK